VSLTEIIRCGITICSGNAASELTKRKNKKESIALKTIKNKVNHSSILLIAAGRIWISAQETRPICRVLILRCCRSDAVRKIETASVRILARMARRLEHKETPSQLHQDRPARHDGRCRNGDRAATPVPAPRARRSVATPRAATTGPCPPLCPSRDTLPPPRPTRYITRRDSGSSRYDSRGSPKLADA
jgi:hypothetical protein